MSFYPSWRYHKSLEPVIVNSEEEEKALKGLWADTPAAFLNSKEEGKLEKAQPASKAQEEAKKPEAALDEGKEEFQVLKKTRKGDK